MTDFNQRLRDIAISESGFVFDPFTGATFSVNSTGRVVLEKLREGLSPTAIEEDLARRFDVLSSDDLGRDVREFVLMLREQGLLPRDESR